MKNTTYSYEKNITRLRILQAAAALLLASAFPVFFFISGRAELPQLGGTSLLTLISDDTRSVVSDVMLKKADEYFHGGVKIENCSHERVAAKAAILKNATAAAAGQGEHEYEHEHDPAHCSVPECTDESHRLVPFSLHHDPFRWINSQVHTQEHRHLKAARSVELLPWIEAAVRTSPHNIRAYDSGSYILDRMTGKPQLAADLLKKGIENNPETPVLESSLGELFYNIIKDKQQAAVHFDRALEKSVKQKGKLSTDDRFLRLKIYFYIGLIAKDKHDKAKLRSVYEMAYKINPDSVMTKSLAGWLAEEETRRKE